MTLSEQNPMAMQQPASSTLGRRRLSGKKALFEQLVADGVRCVFGNPGTTEQSFMDMLLDYPSITFYLALHEGVAVSMADAYARATRKPALVELHVAPGLGNAMGLLYNTWAGRSPLVIYVGQSPAAGLFQEPNLSADLVAMARPLTKWATQINQAADIPQALRRAFKVAEEPPQGPVVLAIPMDVLDIEADVLIRPTPFVQWRVRPPQGAVEATADLLRAARSPAIAIGDHVGLANAQGAVVGLAELLGAPILNAFSNGVNAPAGHPLYQPRGIPLHASVLRKALEPYDALLAVGTPLFSSFVTDTLGPIPATTRVIHVDYESWELGKNHPSDLLVRADPLEMLVALEEELLRRSTPDMRRQWQERRNAIERENLERRRQRREAQRKRWDAQPIVADRLMAELAQALPPDAVIFDESITSGGSLEMYLEPAEPWRRFRARGGSIGGGLPGTLGLQVAFPDRPVFGVVSDGASMYTITALWTAARYRLPVKYVVCDNGGYRILKQNLRDYRGGETGRPYPYMDLNDPALRFDRIAESFGVAARRVERPGELAAALAEARDYPGPFLVDVVLDGSL